MTGSNPPLKSLALPRRTRTCAGRGRHLENALRDLQFGSDHAAGAGRRRGAGRTHRAQTLSALAAVIELTLVRPGKECQAARLAADPSLGRLLLPVCVVDRTTGDTHATQEGTHACCFRSQPAGFLAATVAPHRHRPVAHPSLFGLFLGSQARSSGARANPRGRQARRPGSGRCCTPRKAARTIRTRRGRPTIRATSL